MTSMNETGYLTFPFTVSKDGPSTSDRSAHVREQIEQVLFTAPKERVFRPEFGVGVRALVFEPNNAVLRNSTLKRLEASLVEALQREVDPRTIAVAVESDGETLLIRISYVLAALNKQETHRFTVGASGGSHG